LKAVIQRVNGASVSVDDVLKGRIDSGLLAYIGVARNDSQKDADWLSEKIANLRIFNDELGKMNLSLNDLTLASSHNIKESRVIGVLAISQFTLLADARKGRRPSWNAAAPPETAKQLYEYLISSIKNRGLICESGEFQARMSVTYTNDGPVTIILDSNEK